MQRHICNVHGDYIDAILAPENHCMGSLFHSLPTPKDHFDDGTDSNRIVMLVTRVLGDCPGCGAKGSFGNVSVHEYVLRGCTHCQYQSMVWLPEIRKKVIYLDQFFFSGALRGNDPRFKVAAERVRQMCHLQLLVAPYSSVHEDETHQWRSHEDQLMEFIKATSRGAEFEKDYKVERTQVLKAWEAFLKSQPPEYVLEDGDAIRGALNEWDDYFRIDVGGYMRDVELKRRLKGRAVDELVKVLDLWQTSTQNFDEAVALEIHDAGRQYLDTYLTMLRRYAEGDFSAAINSPMIAKVMEHMMHWLPKEQSVPERVRRCREFFQSQQFAEVPNEWLSSHMFATMREMVKRGTFSKRDEARKRLSGVFEDIKHISLYAPYCDAIVIDKFMADLVGKPTVNLEKRYCVKVFSLNNWDSLLGWLDNLEVGMSEEHKAGVAAAYPDVSAAAMSV